MRNPPYKPQAKEIRCLGWIRGDHGWTYSAHISRNWAFQSRPYLLLERIKRWNYLENILIKFQIEDKRYTGLNYKPPFLESSYLLGQLIYRNNLLPPDSIKEMTIFERTTLLRMIEYHVSSSLAEERETTGNAFKHFHQPIKGNVSSSSFSSQSQSASSSPTKFPEGIR
ncbi:hypothetical protein PSHT_03244 [Puccinia striiformis]|uniref:Uncharacterized protein n=1 Tax=Puccinia striiformis TaxID=27350 RepID=A0A2S4WFV1_9BASI|nr:hypothetical protein PSHT_03244 [Puccinia striiformis]